MLEISVLEKYPQYKINVPEELDFICPIGQCFIMVCPVRLSSNGGLEKHAYEALQVAEWMYQKSRSGAPKSPMTSRPVELQLTFDKDKHEKILAFFQKAKEAFIQKNKKSLENPTDKNHGKNKQMLIILSECANRYAREKEIEKIKEQLQAKFPNIKLIGFPGKLLYTFYGVAHFFTSMGLSYASLYTNNRINNPERVLRLNVGVLLGLQVPSLVFDTGAVYLINRYSHLFAVGDRSSKLEFLLGFINLAPALAYAALSYFSYWEYIIAEASMSGAAPEFALATFLLSLSNAAVDLVRSAYHFARAVQTCPVPQGQTLTIEELPEDVIIDITPGHAENITADNAAAAAEGASETTRLIPRV
jgi:hypothetical protein